MIARHGSNYYLRRSLWSVDPWALRPLDYFVGFVAILALTLVYIAERNLATDLQRSIFRLQETEAQLYSKTALLEVECTKLENRERVMSYAFGQLGMIESKPEKIEYILYVPSVEKDQPVGPKRAIHYAGVGITGMAP